MKSDHRDTIENHEAIPIPCEMKRTSIEKGQPLWYGAVHYYVFMMPDQSVWGETSLLHCNVLSEGGLPFTLSSLKGIDSDWEIC